MKRFWIPGFFALAVWGLLPGASGAEPPRQQPKLLRPADCGIGSRVADIDLCDLGGNTIKLSDFCAGHPTVIAMVSTSCPVSKRYLPALAALQAEYASKDVKMLLVSSDATDSESNLEDALSKAGAGAPCVRDKSGAFARSLGATSSTDAFLLDKARTLVYRGAIDDQYGIGYSLDAPRRRFLAEAVTALLDGRRPTISATEAPGCALDLSNAQAAAVAPTYHNRISRIVQSNCEECHRAGGIAPFSLQTYEQVRAKAGMIRKMVGGDLMPPWFAQSPAAATHTPWANDRSLAPKDKEDLLAWLASDKPAGDPSDAPLPRTWAAEWQIGEPDAIVEISHPIDVQASGVMPYQNVIVDTHFGEDKWVRGMEVRPSAREVVHHVLVFALKKGEGAHRGDGLTNGFFAAYVPGGGSVIFPDGLAKPLEEGSRLVFQIHYTPNGTATHDQVRLGLLFSKEPPEHIVHVAGIFNPWFKIPPGAENERVTGVIPVLRPVKVTAFMPHMHLRGKAFRFESILSDGTTRTLLDVPRYDFNWQICYRYVEPLDLPVGSKVTATGWFDNSAKNPANPDPSKTVHWGQQTTDEMMLGYVEYYFTDETPRARLSASGKAGGGN